MKAYVDSDGFLLPNYSKPSHVRKYEKVMSMDKDVGNEQDLFEQYYLALRSSIFLCLDDDDTSDESVISDIEKILTKIRESMLELAVYYTRNHLMGNYFIPLDFIYGNKQFIDETIKDKYPNAKKIRIIISMKPFFSARAMDDYTISVPALLRAILIQFNLTIISSIYEYTDDLTNINNCDFYRFLISGDDSDSFEFDQDVQNAREIIPYLLFCHEDISVANLPFFAPYTSEVVNSAMLYTNIQLLFVMAHEYAHILLNHFGKDDDKNIFESEADSFATDILLSCKEYPATAIFTAIRWLFKYQFLEEIVGKLIRGEEVNNNDSVFQFRRGAVQLDIRNKSEEGVCSVFEAMGFTMLVNLQKVLFAKGPAFIDEILGAIERSKGKGEIEPWWEKIIQK